MQRIAARRAESRPESRAKTQWFRRLFPVPGKRHGRFWRPALTVKLSRFPGAVRDAMQSSGAAATCVAVQLDGDDWEAALFIQLAGAECKADRRAIKQAQGPLPVGMESDLIETDNGAVVVLRPEVHTQPGDPFVCEILLTPGDGGMHFETLKLLSRQPRLCWFFGDQSHWILHSQQHALEAAQHDDFDALSRDALKHDTMVRMSKRYDARAALAEIVKHYELRAGIGPGEYRSTSLPASRTPH